MTDKQKALPWYAVGWIVVLVPPLFFEPECADPYCSYQFSPWIGYQIGACFFFAQIASFAFFGGDPHPGEEITKFLGGCIPWFTYLFGVLAYVRFLGI